MKLAASDWVKRCKLDVDFRDGIGSGASKQRLRRVESNVVNRLFKLLPMDGEFLDARLSLDIPQPD